LQAAAGRPANSRYDERTIEDPLVLSYIEKLTGRLAKLETEPATKEEVAATARAPEWVKRRIDVIRQQAGVQGRSDVNNDRKLRQEAAAEALRQTGYWEAVSERAESQISEKAADQIREQTQQVEGMVALLSERQDGNPMALSGREAVFEKISGAMTEANVQSALRAGGRMTEGQRLVLKDIVQPSLTQGRTFDTILASLTGRTRQDFTEVAKYLLYRQIDVEYGRGRGLIRKDTTLTDEEIENVVNLWGGERIDAKALALGRLRPGGQYTAEQLREFEQRYQVTPEEIMSVLTGGGQQ
jgi:hypothetical protein